MTITALPEDTVRLLGSHTVIATAVDLVKELLDNAIDAKASSVDILVSPNIVDKIEVRDNGQGIHPDDYTSLGRAGHTSKITSFEDLRTLGGTTLGFRGQALASANNLGTVTITTRTAEDPTAVQMRLFPGVGGVESHRRTSAPIGTTVSVLGLYSRLPVREQAAIKDALNSLVKIKQLLHAYALARPQIRLSFRVLGGSNKQAFSYSPHPEAGVKEAVVQIFGMVVASQCLTRTICSVAGSENGEITEGDEKLYIEAVLPKSNADQSRVAKGPFFSVDSRPVAAQRETMKTLLAIFKAQFSECLQTTYGEKLFKDPFILVNIRCSPNSYDPNIEPSKNVVLFSDDSQLIQLFGRLCAEVYCRPESNDPATTFGKPQLLHGPQIQTPPASSDSSRREEPTISCPNEATHDLPIRSQRTHLPSSSSPIRQVSTRSGQRRRPAPPKTAGRGFTFDMSADPDTSSDEEAERIASQFRHQEDGLQTEDGDEDATEALNPWTIAKMNAPTPRNIHSNCLLTEQYQGPRQIREPSDLAKSNEAFDNLSVLRPFGDAPTDLDASRTFRLSVRPTRQQQLELSDFQNPFNHSLTKIPVSHDSLQPPLQPSEAMKRQTLPTLQRTAHEQFAEKVPKEDTRGNNPESLVQTSLVFGGRPRNLQRPEKSQVQRHINNIPSKTRLLFRQPKQTSTRNKHPSIPNQGPIDKHVLQWVDNHRLTEYRLGSMEPPSTPGFSIPHQPESYDADVHVDQLRLSGTSRRDEIRETRDSNATKRQRSTEKHKSKGRHLPSKGRATTDQLLLEATPRNHLIERPQRPVQILEVDIKMLAANLDDMAGSDDFCNSYYTKIEASESLNLDDVKEVEVRLKDLLSIWTERVLGEKFEVHLELRRQVTGKRVVAI